MQGRRLPPNKKPRARPCGSAPPVALHDHRAAARAQIIPPADSHLSKLSVCKYYNGHYHHCDDVCVCVCCCFLIVFQCFCWSDCIAIRLTLDVRTCELVNTYKMNTNMGRSRIGLKRCAAAANKASVSCRSPGRHHDESLSTCQ